MRSFFIYSSLCFVTRHVNLISASFCRRLAQALPVVPVPTARLLLQQRERGKRKQPSQHASVAFTLCFEAAPVTFSRSLNYRLLHFFAAMNPTGGTPASNPPAPATGIKPPDELILAVRAAITSGMSPDEGKLLDGNDGKSYSMASILEAIRAEDDASGERSTPANRKKSKHCIPRLAELIIDDRFRDRFAASRTQLSRAELDRKETGRKRSILFELYEAFKDSSVKVRAEDCLCGHRRSPSVPSTRFIVCPAHYIYPFRLPQFTSPRPSQAL